jgi:hypothetical protein
MTLLEEGSNINTQSDLNFSILTFTTPPSAVVIEFVSSHKLGIASINYYQGVTVVINE